MKPTLQEGTADTANVTVLQQQLNAHGYNVGTPDGSFGPGTKAQVVKFQQDNKITPADGVVNQATWNALLANPSGSSTLVDHDDDALTQRRPPGRDGDGRSQASLAFGARRRARIS